jgi:hypothetical protein
MKRQSRASVTICIDYKEHLTRFVRGVAFKGSKTDERCDWQWIPTPNRDVKHTVSGGRALCLKIEYGAYSASNAHACCMLLLWAPS